MSRVDDRTAELWRAFMPRRNEIHGRADEHFVSMQVFPRGRRSLRIPRPASRNGLSSRCADPKAREEIWIPVKRKAAREPEVGRGDRA